MGIMKFRFVISILLFFLCTSLYSQQNEYQAFALQTNYNLSFGYDLDPKFNNNYFHGKILVDLAEGWFNRFGISSAIGGDIGSSKNSDTSSSLIATLYTPEIAFSYYILPKLVASAGLAFTQTWYITKEESSLNTVNTLIYSSGLALPVKLRYYCTDYIAAHLSVNFFFHPWISIQDKNGKNKSIYDAVTQMNVGVTFSVPSRRF